MVSCTYSIKRVKRRKKMKNVKRIALMLVCILVVGVLGGCGAKFDPVAYTQANLDNVFKNDSAKLVEMGAGTAEEAEEIFNQGIDAQMSAFTSRMKISACTSSFVYPLHAPKYSHITW